MTTFSLANIRTDGGTQPRAALSPEVIGEYAEALEAGALFPPVVVFYDGSEYWLADGFHRFYAHARTGRSWIEAEVRQGTLEEAQWYSFSVNQTHGLRRTNEDKRRAVEGALMAWSKRFGLRPVNCSEIARHTGVSIGMVTGYAREMESNLQNCKIAPTVTNDTSHTPTPYRKDPAYQKYTQELAAFEADPSQGTPLAEFERQLRDDWNRSAFRPDGDKYREYAEEETEPAPIAAPAWYQSSASDDWWTPQWLFELLDAEIGFETDVCASDANAKCGRYFTREQDGLAQAWTGKCWMNPPYGRSGGVSIYAWIEKAHDAALAGATVACFIPARTDTTWWWDFCIYGEVRFLKGRVKFANSDSIAPFPSAVVIFWPFLPSSKSLVTWWPVRNGEVALDS